MPILAAHAAEVNVMAAIRKNDTRASVNEAGLELRSVQAGEILVGFERWPKGRVEGLFEGLDGNECQASHWGYVIRGKVRVRTAQGEKLVQAGEAYHLAPGHTLVEVLEPVELVEFTPAKDPYLADSVKAFQRNLPKVLATLKATH